MRLTPRSSNRPCQVGLLVYVVLVLTSSLLASPWVAAGMDFGHWHPDGEPSHEHDITGILTGAVTAALVVAAVALIPVSRLIPIRTVQFTESVLCLSRAIRAPPVLG